MNVFRIVFSLLMVLFPMAFTWFLRARGPDVDRARLRQRRVRLHLETALAVIVTIFGTRMSGERMKIRRLLDDLSASEGSATVR